MHEQKRRKESESDGGKRSVRIIEEGGEVEEKKSEIEDKSEKPNQLNQELKSRNESGKLSIAASEVVSQPKEKLLTPSRNASDRNVNNVGIEPSIQRDSSPGLNLEGAKSAISQAHLNEDVESLDSDEREFLENISWDTESDEDLLIEDQAQCSDLADVVASIKKKTSVAGDFDDSINESIRQKQTEDTYEDFFDFYCHDLLKKYSQVTSQYKIYRKRLKKQSQPKDSETPKAA